MSEKKNSSRFILLAVAKTSHINLRIHGYMSPRFIQALTREYGGSIKWTRESDDEYVTVTAKGLAKDLGIDMSPGAAVRVYRQNFKWTQAQLGEKLEVRASFISDLENGRRMVSKQTAKELAKIFKVSVAHFV